MPFNRIIKRGRQGESISLEYLTQCNNYHDAWIDSIASNNKLIIDGNSDNKDTQFYINIINMSEINQDIIWNIIDKYFVTNTYSLVEHNLESYNLFFS